MFYVSIIFLHFFTHPKIIIITKHLKLKGSLLINNNIYSNTIPDFLGDETLTFLITEKLVEIKKLCL